MLGTHEIDELPAGVILLDDAVADVGPVEARHEHARLAELEPLEDLGARLRVSGRRERDARHTGKALVQHRELQVLRAKIVAPLRHAVRLVDGKQCQATRGEQIETALRQQPLGRHIDEIELAAAHATLHLRGLRAAQRRVEKRRAHAELGERGNLVLHQRDER